MRLKIIVTAQDIQRGKRASNSRCPIARAIRRALRANSFLSVESTYALVGKRYATTQAKWDSAMTISLPKAARAFIVGYDYRSPVKPFSFYITGVPLELV